LGQNKKVIEERRREKRRVGEWEKRRNAHNLQNAGPQDFKTATEGSKTFRQYTE
jgi:hypothetical protein